MARDRAAKAGRHVAARAEDVAGEVERWRKAAEQLTLGDLIGAPTLLPDDDKPAELAGEKGAGRPVGARAAAPQEYRRYILATRGDFVARFAGLAQADTFALAALLRCSPLEALQLQRDLGKVAAPYVYQQQPRALEIDGKGQYFAGMVFVAGGPSSPEASGKGLFDAAAALAGGPVNPQEIQALEPVKFAVSEQPASERDAADDEEAP